VVRVEKPRFLKTQLGRFYQFWDLTPWVFKKMLTFEFGGFRGFQAIRMSTARYCPHQVNIKECANP